MQEQTSVEKQNPSTAASSVSPANQPSTSATGPVPHANNQETATKSASSDVKLTEADILFRSFDVDRDSFVSTKEYREGMERQNNVILDAMRLSLTFRQFDKNGDGYLNREEFDLSTGN